MNNGVCINCKIGNATFGVLKNNLCIPTWCVKCKPFESSWVYLVNKYKQPIKMSENGNSEIISTSNNCLKALEN